MCQNQPFLVVSFEHLNFHASELIFNIINIHHSRTTSQEESFSIQNCLLAQ